ncbi:MAG: phosphate ABC transporter permease, partial [Psychrobium sp.]|nr:phosphate ABC transporter permease [Psychrobium sp.]
MHQAHASTSNSLVRSSRSSLRSNDRMRGIKDKIAQVCITAGGLMVLMTLLMIFGYLLYVVEPVFRDAKISQAQHHSVQDTSKIVAMGSDELNEIAYFYEKDATLNFYPLLPSSPPASQFTLPLSAQQQISSFAKTTSDVAFGLSDGVMIISQTDFTLTYSDNGRSISAGVRYPLGEQGLVIDELGKALIKLAYQRDEEQISVIALTSDHRLLYSRLNAVENFMTEEIEWQSQRYELAGAPAKIDKLLLTPEQRLLFVLSDNKLYIYDLTSGSLQQPRQVLEINEANAQVTDIALLSGGSSVLVGNDNGTISQWFETNGPRGRRLTRIRDFSVVGSVTKIHAEPYRKTFAVINGTGDLELFHSTSEADLLQAQLTSPAHDLQFSPRNNALMFKTATGIDFYHLENEHPEVTLSALW